jgi:hypothetical protein
MLLIKSVKVFKDVWTFIDYVKFFVSILNPSLININRKTDN